MKLSDALINLYKSDEYPLHMPGHKREDMGELSSAYHLDITEIEGYDNLYDAQGILKAAMSRAAKLYNCENTFYLVNGSTTGILTAISSVGKNGDHIVIASNCHRSVTNIVELIGLIPHYVYPSKLVSKDIDGAVLSVDVQKTIDELNEKGNKPCAVVITSPNYDGIISDISAITEKCHIDSIPLIVDEAHGAHLSLDDRLPKGAIECGADIIIHSTHKTLAAMTQTALLHVQGNLVDINQIKKYWHTFQTSSPSYVLMASIDEAVNEILEKGPKLWDDFFSNLEAFREKCRSFKYLKVLEQTDIDNRNEQIILDPCKISVITSNSGITGTVLQRLLLDDYHIQIELASEERIIAIVTYKDSQEGFARFAKALEEIDNKIENGIYFDMKVSTQASASSNDTRNLYAPCIPHID